MDREQHTPGPWYVASRKESRQGLIISETTGANIAVTYDSRDAELVAAAPDLLHALRRIAALPVTRAHDMQDFAQDALRSVEEQRR